MDPSDISLLFFGDEASGPEHAQALAQALRGQQQMGLMGALSGDKVLSNVGNHLLQGVQQQQDLIPKAANMRLQRAMEAEKQKTEQAFRQAQEAHMAKAEAFQQQQLNQSKYAMGPGGVLNTKSGAVTPWAPGEGPPAKGVTATEQEKEWQALGRDTSTYTGRGNLNKENQQRLGNIDRLEAMLGGGDLNAKTPQQVREATTALASVIANGGSSAMGQIEELTPHTLQAKLANAKQFLLNEPQGAEAQDFLRQILETAAREKDVISKQVHSGQVQKLPVYAHLRGKDKTRFNSILKGAGIDPEAIDDAGLEMKLEKAAATATPAAAHPQADAAMQWAKDNPNDPRSKAILQKLGEAP